MSAATAEKWFIIVLYGTLQIAGCDVRIRNYIGDIRIATCIMPRLVRRTPTVLSPAVVGTRISFFFLFSFFLSFLFVFLRRSLKRRKQENYAPPRELTSFSPSILGAACFPLLAVLRRCTSRFRSTEPRVKSWGERVHAWYRNRIGSAIYSVL